jgi:hypothetical protein
MCAEDINKQREVERERERERDLKELDTLKALGEKL